MASNPQTRLDVFYTLHIPCQLSLTQSFALLLQRLVCSMAPPAQNLIATRATSFPPSPPHSPDTAKQLAVILDPERPNRIRMFLKFLRSLPEAQKYGTDYVIAAAGNTPGQPVDPDTEFTWAIVTSGPPQLKAEFGPGCRPYQIDDEGSSVSITA